MVAEGQRSSSKGAGLSPPRAKEMKCMQRVVLVRSCLLLSRAQISCAKEKLEDAPSTQISLAMPVESKLRTTLFPKRNVELLLRLLDSSKDTFGSNKPGNYGKQAPGNGGKWEAMREWLIHTERSPTNLDSPTASQNLRFLLLLCLKSNQSSFLEALLGMVLRNKIELAESHYNQLLLSMDKFGWHRQVARNFRRLVKTGIKCRIRTMFTLVMSAVQRKDFRFASEVMAELVQVIPCKIIHHGSGDFSLRMDLVVDGCVGAGRWGEVLVGQVLEWHRAGEVDLSQKMVDSLLKWVKRCV